MATIKFDYQAELDELIARIYLDTKIKFTKKELLEKIFEIESRDYQNLLKKIVESQPPEDQISRKNFIKRFSGCLTINEEETIQPKDIWAKDPETE